MNKLIKISVFLSTMFVLALIMPGIVHAQYSGCTSNYQERCLGNNLYWYDSCGDLQGLAQYCSNGCYNNSCQSYYNYNYNNTCSYHSYERCSGNNLYWYDSCGNLQDVAQYCSNGCYNNSCYNNYNYNYNYNNYNNCTSHAYKLCVGNNIYWYDSCNNQQDIYYNCINGQTCQYGQCVAFVQNYNIIPANNYVAYFKTACYGNSLYWYDSLGVRSGLYKNCQDANSCTVDACSRGKCSNTLKCDGSACVTGSADYNTYCLPAEAGVPSGSAKEGAITPATNSNSTANPSSNTNTSGLVISFLAKQDSNSNQWQKTAQVGSNSQVYFMISVKNNSSAKIDNVNISANIPSEISSLGNLQLNGAPVSGDIVSGIDIGSVAQATTKSITFEGRTQMISESPATKQATATSNVSGATQSDSISINLNPSQATAAVSSTPATSSFWGFLKHWYLWILIGLVLLFLFIVVFRRLSSNI